ncbi:hypothetical protein PhaeoP78_00359 [Phaeobacter inhibens]|nr:hypothetical protein PhaeoP78_00359 [Phaeobacter inhibens]
MPAWQCRDGSAGIGVGTAGSSHPRWLDIGQAEPVLDGSQAAPPQLPDAVEPTDQVDASTAETILTVLLESAGWDADLDRIRSALPHARHAFDG